MSQEKQIIQVCFGEHPYMPSELPGWQMGGMWSSSLGEGQAWIGRDFPAEMVGLTNKESRVTATEVTQLNLKLLSVPGKHARLPQEQEYFEKPLRGNLDEVMIQYFSQVLQQSPIAAIRTYYWWSDVARTAAQRLGIPTLFTPHATALVKKECQPELIIDPHRVAQEREALSHSEHTIVSTDWERRAIARLYAGEKTEAELLELIHAIGPGIDPKYAPENRLLHRQKARSGYGIAPGSTVFAIAGRSTIQKNHHLALKAFDELVRQSPNADVTLLWSTDTASDNSSFSSTIKRALTAMSPAAREKVRIVPFVNNFLHFLAAADTYISLSGNETFGLTVAEAASSGLPVITSSIPAFLEMTGRETNNPWSIALSQTEIALIENTVASMQLACDPAARATEANRLRAKISKYTWENYTKQVIAAGLLSNID